jgi:exodeoxyribonuclease VII small subunit
VSDLPQLPDDLTFEEAQRALAERVERLESGQVGLDEALRLFQEGVAYQRFCERRLTEIRGRIEELSASALPPLEPPAAEDDTPF